MAKDKDRALNPAAAQRKADKNRALKKSKAAVTTQRNEKLARRNPERLQRQIDELKEAETNGSIKPREKQTLDQLEKDVKAIRKAREALGDKAPQYGRGDRPGHGTDQRPRGGGVLGKRRRDGDRHEGSQSSDTDPDVADIPMPRDTPPPIPRPQPRSRTGENNPTGPDTTLPDKPPPATQKVYSSAPQIRDLQKEATARFVPAAVKRNVDGPRGSSRPSDSIEAGKRESQGSDVHSRAMKDAQNAADLAESEAVHRLMAVENEITSTSGTGNDTLEEEERRFERELQDVDMEGNSSPQAKPDLLGKDGWPEGDRSNRKEPGKFNVELEEVEDEES